jgi:hypothetical protein
VLSSTLFTYLIHEPKKTLAASDVTSSINSSSVISTLLLVYMVTFLSALIIYQIE